MEAANDGASHGWLDKMERLKQVHDQKVRSLMKSIHILKGQLTIAKASSKEHRRSGLIQQLRHAVQEQEAVVDVLRQALLDRGMDDQNVTEIILKHTNRGPKRFRPKSREELQVDNAALSKRIAALEAKLRKRASASGQPHAQAPPARVEGRGGDENVAPPPMGHMDLVTPPPASTLGSISSPHRAAFESSSPEAAGHNRGLKHQVDELDSEVASLRATLASAERMVGEQAREIQRLKIAETDALSAVDRAEMQKHRYRSMKQELKEERSRRMRIEALVAGLEAKVNAQEEELRLKSQVLDVESSATREEFNRRMTELRDAYLREQEVNRTLEQERDRFAGERKLKQHALRQEVAKGAELERIRDALETRNQHLEQQNKGLLERMAEMESSMTEGHGYRAKLRAANEHNRDLAVRAKDLQTKVEGERILRAKAEATLEQQDQLFNALKSEAELLRREYNDVQREGQSLKERVRSMAEQQQAGNLRERELQQRVEQQLREATEYQVKLQESNRVLQNLQDESNLAKSELERSFDEAQFKAGEASSRAEELAKDKARLEEEIQACHHDLQAARAQADALSQSLELANRKSGELSETIAAQESKIAELQEESVQQNDVHKASREQLSRKVVCLEEELENLQAAKQQEEQRMGHEVRKLNDELDRYREKLRKAWDEVKKAHSELASNATDLPATRSKIESLEVAMASNQASSAPHAAPTDPNAQASVEPSRASQAHPSQSSHPHSTEPGASSKSIESSPAHSNGPQVAEGSASAGATSKGESTNHPETKDGLGVASGKDHQSTSRPKLARVPTGVYLEEQSRTDSILRDALDIDG